MNIFTGVVSVIFILILKLVDARNIDMNKRTKFLLMT